VNERERDTLNKISLLLFIIVGMAQVSSAQHVWSSANGTTTFTKQAFADWKLADNQDRISDSVWITRASTQSIFNIRKDTSYKTDAPSGTMWAFGRTDSFAAHTYKTFVSLSGGSPQGLVGKDLVLHLVAENIYLDVKFLSYAGGNTGGSFSYIRAAANGGVTSVPVTSAPARFALEQNYPNPFNPSTTFGFTLQNSGLTSLKVYNVVGQEVTTLVNEVLEAGVYHQRMFDARNLASGVYFARLVSGDRTQMRKILLMK